MGPHQVASTLGLKEQESTSQSEGKMSLCCLIQQSHTRDTDPPLWVK
jgi:hypothetical protein